MVETLYATYIQKERRLKLSGPFNRRVIDDVIKKMEPFPHTFNVETPEQRGDASFNADNEAEALAIRDRLESRLNIRSYDGIRYRIEYWGVVS